MKAWIAILTLLVLGTVALIVTNTFKRPQPVALTTEKAKPTANFPAAGVCGEDERQTVDIIIANWPDNVPQPRCVKLRADQRIGFSSSVEEDVVIEFAGNKYNLKKGEDMTIQRAIGAYLEPGVYVVKTTPNYSVSEIWYSD